MIWRSTTPCYDADFYPFGGERAYTNSCPQNYKFTGKERDPESGLDDFEARFYGSSVGRFTSPDDPFVGWNFADPQSLNLYAYVQDNPINAVDPTGHCYYVASGTGGIRWSSSCSIAEIGDPANSDAWAFANYGGMGSILTGSQSGEVQQNELLAAEGSYLSGWADRQTGQAKRHKAKHHKRKSAYKPRNRMANVLFNETGTIQGDAQSLHEMRVAAGHVYMNVKRKSAFQGRSTLDAGDQAALANGIGVAAYNDSVSAASEALSDPSDPTDGKIHFFIRDTTSGGDQYVPSWANGNEMVFGPFTAGADNLVGGADTHAGDTIYVWINSGP
jgi:RHS repeat-associated protein